MSSNERNDHLGFSREVQTVNTTLQCSSGGSSSSSSSSSSGGCSGPSWKMENMLRLGLTSNSLIPTPKSGKYSGSSAADAVSRKQNNYNNNNNNNNNNINTNNNSKLSKTEENKLRLILHYDNDDDDDDDAAAAAAAAATVAVTTDVESDQDRTAVSTTNTEIVDITDHTTDKELKINTKLKNISKIISQTKIPQVHHSNLDTINHRFDAVEDKAQQEADYEDERNWKEESCSFIGSLKRNNEEIKSHSVDYNFISNERKINCVIPETCSRGLSLNNTIEPLKSTSLGVTPRPSDSPSTTHPTNPVVPTTLQTPQSPQSLRRIQTRCTRGNFPRTVTLLTTDTPTLQQLNKVNKEDVMEPELKEKDELKSSTPSPELLASRIKSYNEADVSSEDESGGPSNCSRTQRLSSLYHGTWPVERGLWNNQQITNTATLVNQQSTSTTVHNDIASVMSFSSSVSMGDRCPGGRVVQGIQGQRRLGAKVDVVYSLLGMLGGAEGREDMSATLLSMSSSTDSCLAMRQSGCLPLLVQLIHAPGQDPETRERASQAIHNIVHSRGEERAGRREARVLRLLEQLRDYCQTLRTTLEAGQPLDDFDRHPGPTIAALMKLSFDEAHRHAMCQLGGLHAVAELIEMDHAAHGSECDDQNCVTLRRYAGMALTNLTFGDGNNKALLCSFREFMKALVAQLRSPSDDLRQVTASVLRNLSWRADSSSKQTLREVGAVVGLTTAAMEGKKESTLKSILSALWNLSAHCSTNKIDICAVEGALTFLVDMLSYKAPSKTLAIVENAGGILRNVSSHIAVREDYRSILRERGCLQVLLRQLRSPSLTVVSNACGALWNLSARCPQDQRMLWDLGAVPMLRSLVHSKHKMISMGSSAALKNLLGARPGSSNLVHLDSTARGLGLPTLPTLVARRQRALEQEIDQNLAETCDNIEPSTSPTNKEDKFGFKVERRFVQENDARNNTGHSYQMQNSQPGPSNLRFNTVARSESRESIRSITSTHSDTIFERVNRHVLNGVSPTESQAKQQSSSLHSATGFNNCGISNDGNPTGTNKGCNLDRKYVLRYKNAVPERHRPPTNDIGGDLRCTTSTMSWASAADQEAACSQIMLHSSIDENTFSNELSKPLIYNRDDIKSQYICKDFDTSGIKRPGISLPVSSLPRYNAQRDISSSQDGGGGRQFINPKEGDTLCQNGETTGAIKREISNLPKSVDYRLRYAASGIDDDDEKQHSGYFAESEEGLHAENQCLDKTQYKIKSSKVSRDFNDKDCGLVNNESLKTEPTKIQKYERDHTHRIEEASNSISSIGSSIATVKAEKSSSADCIVNEIAIENSNHKIKEVINNDFILVVEAKNDICTLGSVSDDETIHDFSDHQEEQNSLIFPQYESLGLLDGFDQSNSLNYDHKANVSNSSQQLESLPSGNESLESTTERVSLNSLQQSIPIEIQHQTPELCFQSLPEAGPCSLLNDDEVDPGSNSSIDDETKITNDSRLKEYGAISSTAGIPGPEEMLKPLNLDIESILEDNEEDNETNEADNDSDSEMRTNRHRQAFRRSSLEKSPPPVSNLARYQTSSALNQVDVATPVNLTTGTPSFRQSINDCEDTIPRDVEELGQISRAQSPVSITEHERDNESIEDTSELNYAEVRRESTIPNAFSPIFENSDANNSVETASIRELASPEENPSASIAVSGTTGTEEVNITEAEKLLSKIQSVLSSHGDRDTKNQDNSLIQNSMPKTKIDKNRGTENRTLFDFDLSSENCSDGKEKDASNCVEAPSPVLLNKIEDDIENRNIISEEENLSDEITSPTIDPLFSAVERAAKKIDRSKNREETEEEYRRQRDPDAMIASLDRLTATLVQQTEAMRERESSAMKQSVVSDTWNEDSPNDVSFPSISVSAPLIASFKSDNQEDHHQFIPISENLDEIICIQGTTMTDSRIIEREANRLADAVNARVAEFDFETMSMTSMDLEAIKPPSTMGSLVSLTTSLIGPIDNAETSIVRERCNSTSLPPLQLKNQIGSEFRHGRKKSLPAGVMAKRALSQYQNHTGSLESLLNEAAGTCSISHLDNVKPPSMMDELLDAMDMENSMLSVASITSEVADAKDQDSQSLTASDPVFDLLKPVANILSMTCMRYADSMQVSGNNSLSECLENINPPSLFNEVSEMDESTMEPTSDTFCSDTLCIDNEIGTEEVCNGRGSSIDRIEECDNDTDDAATPIPSEYCVTSSAESTPKKRHNKNHLTPKQKRQLAKERYKTYTIAAEMVKKEEEERRKLESEEKSRIGKYAGGKCSPFSKLTPKQRRQEDRARFQTQVLNNPFPVLDAYEPREGQTPLGSSTENPEPGEAGSIVKSGIPKFRKSSGGKTIKQKRAENKDRFRTRTLDDEEAQEASRDVDVITSAANQFASSDTSIETMLHVNSSGEMETMLERNSNIVLNILGREKNNGEDVSLDCETLSLVSNDSEPEHNIRMRFANGLLKKQVKPELNTTQYSTCRGNEGKQLSPLKDFQEDLGLLRQNEVLRQSSDSESEEESNNSANEQSEIPKRPRIVKPGTISRDASVDSNGTDKSEPESPKIIRGRRKALYSNPNTRKSTPQTSPSKISNSGVSGIPIGRSNTSPLVRGTRATALRQSFPTKSTQKSIGNCRITSPSTSAVEKRARGGSSASNLNRTSIPQRGTVFNYSKSTNKRHTTSSVASSSSYGIKEDKKEPVIKPLERQGTFTKEEPEVENAPTVLPPCSSPTKSKIAKPIKTSPSRIQTPVLTVKPKPPLNKVFQTPQSKFTKSSSLDKDQTKTSASPTLSYQRRSLIGSPIKHSPSNQSLQSNDSTRNTKKINTALGQRSNSNSSIVSNSSNGGVQGRRTAKEATSKIASLWKRVEESKTKQRFEKNDTRHWITPGNGSIEAGSQVVTTKPPTFRLIRSSTFEGVSKDISANSAGGKPKTNNTGKRQSTKVSDTQNNICGPKYRNSCDLSGMSIAEAPCKIPMKYANDSSSSSRLLLGRKETIQIGDSTVILRRQQTTEEEVTSLDTEIDPTKRVSRLGSFIRVDPPESDESNTENVSNINVTTRVTASAIVSPFNYNPKQLTSPVKQSIISEIDGKIDIADCQMEITTSSMRVTTV